MIHKLSATPREAATVILTREDHEMDGGWECFMVRRPAASDFAADAFVFPGGKVDRSDRNPEILQHVSHEPLPVGEGADGPLSWVGIKLAALRELFEEAGVLLAEIGGRAIRFDGDLKQRFLNHRDRLQQGELSLLDLARTESLRYRTDLLYPFAHWITPVDFPRRYDTWFFVTYLPPGQEPLHHVHEVMDGVWISPHAALDRFKRGAFPLVFATEKQLERMAGFDSVRALIEATTETDLHAVMPVVKRRGSDLVYLLPGEDGYDD